MRLLDLKRLAITASRSILVKPARSKVSPFCIRLTGLTPAMVSGGISFLDACATLETEYESRNRAWASWGNYDLTMFADQCPSFGVPYPFSQHHLNLKALFASVYDTGRQVGMSRALTILSLPLEGKHHRGGDDARNIACIAGRMIADHGRDILLEVWDQ